MKSTRLHTALVAAVVLALPSLAGAQTNGSWNVTISPAAGGTKTAVSVFATGDYTTGFAYDTSPQPSVSVGGRLIGGSGVFGSPSGAWSMATTNFTLSPFGYATNMTTGTSASIDRLDFENYGAVQALSLRFGGGNPGGALTVTNGNTVAFVFDPTPAALEIDLDFSNFTPGTYNGVDGAGNQFNMEVVPEPSTYALLALSAAALGGFVLRRRRN